MSGSLSPPASPTNFHVSTPQATTAAILGASSNGWSPLKLSKKVNSPSEFESHPSPASEAEHPSTQSPKKVSSNFASLRSHALVSNSIFLQGGSGSQPSSNNNSPLSSPSKRTGAAASNSNNSTPGRSIGLGIGVASSSSKIPVRSSPRKPSAESRPNAENESPADVFGTVPSHSSLPKMAPRKSKGFEILQKASYVSNSPFRQPATRPESDASPQAPLPPPQNAWAMAAAAASKTSPTKSQASSTQASPKRPTSHVSSPSGTSSPSNKGLLTSNRLHGPRTMTSSPEKGSEQNGNEGQFSPQSAARRERRKTVTFDEILDVQEFEKESSFDIESMRSDASYDSYDAEPMWVGGATEQQLAQLEDRARNDFGGQLKVVNASPDPDSPELTDQPHDSEPDLSNDSRDASSVEESSSPLLPPLALSEPYDLSGDMTFEKTFNTAGEQSFEDRDRETSFSRLHALDRVDSMVDELLKEDILNSPTIKAQEGRGTHMHTPSKQETTQKTQAEAELDRTQISPPKTRNLGRAQATSAYLQQQATAIPAVKSQHATIQTMGADQPQEEKPLPQEPQPKTSSTPAASLKVDGLPQLPDWSPITFGEEMMAGPSGPSAPASTSTQPSGESPAAGSDRSGSQSGSSSATPVRVTGSLRGRPHISRDAIIERVARERLNRSQESASESGSSSPAVPKKDATATSSSSSGFRAPRGSEPLAKKGSADSIASISRGEGSQSNLHPRPSAPVRANTTGPQAAVAVETRPLPAPSPVKEMKHVESPLEKIAAPGRASADLLRPPIMEDEDDDQQRSSPGPSSGRLSPSTLGAPPPPITPAQQAEQIILRRRSKNGGKGRRKRSMSTGDALPFFSAARDPTSPTSSQESKTSPAEGEEAVAEEEEEEVELPTRESISADLAKSKVMLDMSLQRAIDGGFGAHLEREISRIYNQGELKYKVKDRGAFQGVDDKVSHVTSAGDLDTGKAWKRVRRPSDMNEYAKEMREFRENENPKRVSGKVFVMVDSFTPANLPVPSRPTFFHCVLDNGLHMVKTATVPLRSGAGAVSKIQQEFELIQHKNLEFSLTLVVQRDGHLREPERPSSPSRKEPSSPTLKAFSRLFTSPKKQAAKREQQEREEAAELAAQAARAEPMIAYINREGAFGRTNVVFDKVASECHGRCLVLELPVYGVNNATSTMSGPSSMASRSVRSMFDADFTRNLNKVRGTLRLKLFYLPPMPNMPKTKMPENLGECIRGMQSASWHRAAPWLEGTLTQLGGDCTVSNLLPLA